MNQRNRKNQSKFPVPIFLAFVLFAAVPWLIPIAMVLFVVYGLLKGANQQSSAQPQKKNLPSSTREIICTHDDKGEHHLGARQWEQSSFDDGGKGSELFCFHRDKGEHHLAKGREIDPWDRPDIDVSKYQHKSGNAR